MKDGPDNIQLVNSMIKKQIRSNNVISLSKSLSLLNEFPVLESSFQLERFLCEEIKQFLKSFCKRENFNHFKNLLNAYTSTLIYILQNNLNSTFESLQNKNSNEMMSEIVRSDHLLLNSLNSGNVIRVLLSFIENNIQDLDEFVIKDILQMNFTLLTTIKKFLTIHPFFATNQELYNSLSHSDWKSSIEKLNLMKKEELLRESNLFLQRAFLMNHLLPSESVVYHFLFVSSNKFWKNDLNYILDSENNVNAICNFTLQLPEEYVIMVETSLMLCTEGSVILKDYVEDKKNIKKLGQELEEIIKPTKNNLDNNLRMKVLDWHMTYLNKIVNESSNPLLDLSDELFSDLEISHKSYQHIPLSNWKKIIESSNKDFQSILNLLKNLSNNSKSSNFILFKTTQMESLYQNFFNSFAFTNSHSLYLNLLNIASFKLKDVEIFLDCLQNPLICSNNGLSTKKQSFYFLSTLIKLNKDPIILKKIYSEFELELTHCLTHDRILLEMAFSSRFEPTVCQEIFNSHFLNPIYFKSFKEKMKLFYTLYLQALNSEKFEQTEYNVSLEDAKDKKNQYQNFISDSKLKSNTNIDSLRKDPNGKNWENGNELINGFDPKNQNQDNVYEEMGEIDLRPAAVIDFKSILSSNIFYFNNF